MIIKILPYSEFRKYYCSTSPQKMECFFFSTTLTFLAYLNQFTCCIYLRLIKFIFFCISSGFVKSEFEIRSEFAIEFILIFSMDSINRIKSSEVIICFMYFSFIKRAFLLYFIKLKRNQKCEKRTCCRFDPLRSKS